jgi:hypothetical protein
MPVVFWGDCKLFFMSITNDQQLVSEGEELA